MFILINLFVNIFINIFFKKAIIKNDEKIDDVVE